MNNVIHATEDNFNELVLASTGLVLVDFWATWCGPCKAIAPILDVIASERSDIKVVKIDVDKAEKLAAKYKVRSIPTMILFKDGQEEATKIGAIDKQGLLAWIDSVV